MLNLKFDHLIGQKVDITETIHKHKNSDETLTEFTQISVDKKNAMKKLNLSYHNVLFIIPGYCYTQEVNPTRLKITIDKTGLITKCSVG
jgi:hypothetical protein